MKAVWVTEFGASDVLALRETPPPSPGPAQVAIRVEAAVVNFIDTLARAGRTPGTAGGPQPPYIPGNGVGGTVVEAGSGVDATLIGTRVVASTGGSGGYAEVALASADALVAVPPELDLVTATALLADGRTAVGLCDAARPQPGETALVLAAAGGVGGLLVQLCRSAGARVIGAAGGAEKTGLVRESGVEAIDYDVPGWSDGLDVGIVFDGVGGDRGEAALKSLRPGGRFVQYGLSSGRPTAITRDDVKRIGFEVLRAIGARSAEFTLVALDLAASGQLAVVVGQTFRLDQAADAHAAIQSRATTGRTLLMP